MEDSVGHSALGVSPDFLEFVFWFLLSSRDCFLDYSRLFSLPSLCVSVYTFLLLSGKLQTLQIISKMRPATASQLEQT